MGLLDEAIREHLDLQRRRGADPTEVERAEREALGPVRRAQAPEDTEIDEIEDGAPEVEGEELEHEAGAVDFDHEPGAVAFDHEADGESWSLEPEPPAHEQELDPKDNVAESSPGAEPVGQETAVHRPDFVDEEPFADEELEPRPPLPHSAGGETAEYDVERELGSHPAAEDDSEGEELLEETPEFLQDTPDHDRLWFEQRPPKDFDFDG
jgi:hypothetical protein